MKAIILIFSIFLFYGCASTTNRNFQGEYISLGVEYVDSEKKRLITDDMPSSVYLSFPIIPGALAGDVLFEEQYSVIADIGEKFNIDMALLAKRVAPHAKPFLLAISNTDVVISSKETKLARVATFSFNQSKSMFLGETGLALLNSDALQLILVYFDRPVSITGSGNYDKAKIEYDIHINNAGLSWLKVVNVNQDLLRVTKHAYTGNEVIIIKPQSIVIN